MYSYQDNRTDNEKYLEEQLERERNERNQERERQDREREQRREEWRERYEYDYRHPSDWATALQTQANLCWREHNQFPDDGDLFFKNCAEANEKALEIWNEVQANRSGELAELEKQMEAIRESIRNEIADKLTVADPRKEFIQTAEAIRNDSLEGYCDW